ncbi:MAG: hypothetical protein IIC23_07470 [Chloroflexi bacterium]|nr:hypothetical protein [Chloroflexota bacterium]
MNSQIVNQYLTSKISRRQAIKVGGLAALGLAFSKPIISTIAPTPAFANYAGNGCTPGFWKNHTSTWPSPYNADPLFESVFTVPTAYAATLGSPNSLSDVLQLGGGCEQALGRHGVAAFLNAVMLGATAFGISSAAVVSAVNSALATEDCAQIESAKDNLEGFNERSCPLGGMIS